MAVPFSWMISGTHLLLSNCIPMRPDQRAMVLSLALTGSSALLQICGNPSIFSFLKLFPIALSVCIWGSQMANRCIVFVTDNAALVSIINQQTSKHKLVMILIRDLVLTALNYNIIFRARHIPGLNNTRADCLSRFQIARFKELSPQADELPTIVPEILLPKSWSLT